MTTKPNLDTLEGRLRALADGYKIRMKAWLEHRYIHIEGLAVFFDYGRSAEINMLSQSGWEYYTEPKQKPTMAECLKAEKVRVKCEHPVLAGMYKNSGSTYSRCSGWSAPEIVVFREAITDPDGLGWEIEIVEE